MTATSCCLWTALFASCPELAGRVEVEQNIRRSDRKKRRQGANLVCIGQWFPTLAAQKNHLESFLKIVKLVPHSPESLIYFVCWNSFFSPKAPQVIQPGVAYLWCRTLGSQVLPATYFILLKSSLHTPFLQQVLGKETKDEEV